MLNPNQILKVSRICKAYKEPSSMFKQGKVEYDDRAH